LENVQKIHVLVPVQIFGKYPEKAEEFSELFGQKKDPPQRGRKKVMVIFSFNKIS